MRPALIIIHPPRFDDVLGFGERGKLVDVQALVSQATYDKIKEQIVAKQK